MQIFLFLFIDLEKPSGAISLLLWRKAKRRSWIELGDGGSSAAAVHPASSMTMIPSLSHRTTISNQWTPKVRFLWNPSPRFWFILLSDLDPWLFVLRTQSKRIWSSLSRRIMLNKIVSGGYFLFFDRWGLFPELSISWFASRLFLSCRAFLQFFSLVMLLSRCTPLFTKLCFHGIWYQIVCFVFSVWKMGN